MMSSLKQKFLSRAGQRTDKPHKPALSYLQDDLRDVQAEALHIVLAASVGVVVLALFHTPAELTDLDREKLLAGLLLFLCWLTWRLLARNYRIAVWLLVCGLAGMILQVLRWYPSSTVSVLFALPSILAVAFLGTGAGVMTALVSSVVLFGESSHGFAALSDARLLVSWGVVWGSTGLVWVALRPLHAFMNWTWTHYRRAQELLDEARERQLELAQIRQDLEDANRDLARLNLMVTANQKIAEDARRAKEQFVANVSHELRTPLNMIVGFSELITQDPRVYHQQLPRELLADVAAIQRNAQHLSKLVDDVLDLSKVESGYLRLATEPCSLRDLVRDAMQAVRTLFDSKGLYLEIDTPEDVPEVVCDPTRIRQVLLNLLSNAGRLTEQGGVRVTVTQQENQVVVAVCDTGPGIADEDMASTFEPFRQLEVPYQVREGGTGLGLSISRKLLELHQGRLWLESEQGIGSTFYFSLPLPRAADSKGSYARWFGAYGKYEPLGRPRRARLPQVLPRLLFVDPERILGPLAVRYIANAEIVLVDDWGEALDMIKHSAAQAIVLNDVPPAETEAWQEMLAALSSDMPIFTWRAVGTPSLAKQLGVVDCLVKPITQEALLQAVESVPTPVRTILVVDDHPEAVQLFTRLLASSANGYCFLRATDGKRALEILRTNRPDLLLLDLVMPDFDGFQVLSAIRQDPELANLPVITISAQDPVQSPVAASDLIVTRPVGLTRSDLLNAISCLTQALSPMWRTPGPELQAAPVG